MTSWFIGHHSTIELHWPGESLVFFFFLLSDPFAVNDFKYLLGGWKGEGNGGPGEEGQSQPYG